nr:NAD(P)H-dependent oxidoreductase [Veillonella sp. AF42-16]
MNILIIYTYPNHQSFNSAILKVVQQNLSKEHNVNTLDLYEEPFDPVLRFDDMHKRRDLSTVPDMEKYRNLITWADHIIFIYLFGGAVCRLYLKALSIAYLQRALPIPMVKEAL